MDTTKKLKVIGTESYINTQTGELHEMNVVQIEERDANFQKLWVSSILTAVDELSSQKLKIVFWLVNEAGQNRNVITKTTREMSEEIEVSRTTLIETLQVLEKHDIITRKTGVVFMNPKVVYQGSRGGRMEVLMRYSQISKERIKNEASEEDLEKEEAKLMKRLERLRSKKQELQKQSQEAAAE